MSIKRRLPVLLVAVLLVLSMAACQSSNKAATPSETTAAADTDSAAAEAAAPALNHDPYKISGFSQVANYAGDQAGWFGKLIKDKFGLEINIEASNLEGGASKFATKMVSGDLGDIVVFGDTGEDFKKAIEAGLLVDWTQNGLLDSYGKDLTTRFPAAIEKQKTQFGNGTAVYAIGHDTSDSNEGPGELNDFVWGPYLRWDLYAKLGYPAINTMEDYLPVLKQMRDLEPTTADGKPVYAFSFWKDWDGSHMMNAKQFACMYGYNDDTGGLVLANPGEEKYQGILDDGSYYLRTLKLYFNANQMGLVDPESPTQNWDIVYSKATNGQVLFSWFSWLRPYNTEANKQQGKGLMLVPFKEEEVYSYGKNIYSGQRCYAIGKNAKQPERIMELINWLASNDGAMESINGPEGLAWEYKDGKAVLTDFGLQVRADAQKAMVPDEYGGGAWADGNNKLGPNIVNPITINPKTGEPYDQNGWSFVQNLAPTALDTAWREKMGATTSVEWFEKNGKISIFKRTPTNPDTTLTDDQKQKLDQVGSVIKEYSWKMIFAKDEAEFNALQTEMISKAKGLGYDELAAEQIKDIEEYFQLVRDTEK